MKRKSILVKLLVLLLIGTSCAPKGLNTYRNFANAYDVNRKPAKPSVTLVNISVDTVMVYAKFIRRNLVFATSPGNPPQAWIKAAFSLLPNIESKMAIDSLIFEIGPIVKANLPDTIVLKGKLYAPSGSSYSAIVEVTDVFTKRSQVFIESLNRNIYPSANDFVVARSNHTPCIEPFALAGIPYRISVPTKAATVCISKIRSQNSFPQPVFSNQPPDMEHEFADTSLFLTVFDGSSEVFTIDVPGIYKVTLKEHDLGGMYFEVREKGGFYPLRPNEMAEGMRYITSDEEFAKLLNTNDTKTVIDSFWIATAGNPQRAMSLIKDYFSRVDECKTLFRGSIPGYRTDRGMVYIVWGKPTFVYRSNNIETWIYGEGTDNQVLKFDFSIILKPNGELGYLLNRSIVYREAWFTAVESLRR
jgi:GWxTD domain-containing protein